MSIAASTAPTVPRVSIGLPVYNGGAYLHRAIETLHRQTWTDWELIISDNASTDHTAEIAASWARRDPRIRVVRNSRNLGASVNFERVVALARGEFFMWASHDDYWAPEYVTTLVDCLERHPQAVLATPQAVHVEKNGDLMSRVDRPAMGSSACENMRILLQDRACTWIFGLYRLAWLRTSCGSWRRFDPLGSDLLWLLEAVLQYSVTGSSQAVIYKRWNISHFAPTTWLGRVLWRLEMLYGMTYVCWFAPRSPAERWVALREGFAWYYREVLRRRTWWRTLTRCARLAVVDSLTAIPYAICCVFGLRRMRT